MTLFGFKRGGRHLLRNRGKHLSKSTGASAEKSDGADSQDGPVKVKKPKWNWKKRAVVISAITVAALLALAGSFYGYLKWAVKKDPVVEDNPAYTNPINPTIDPDNPIPPGQAAPGQVNPANPGERGYRDYGKLTFLLLATDDGSNTDTIMVATLDLNELTFEVVSIPRDTMVNVSWSLKKANSIYSHKQLTHRGDSDMLEKTMADTVIEFSKFLGYRVDYWAVVNLRAFVTLVNTIGGVDFYIPVDMDYDDYDQGLHIHYTRGMKHLTGQQALEVVRFRNTYASGDIRRISVQQDFMMAAVKQILAKSGSVNTVDFVKDLAAVFIRDVKTNIPLENLIRYGNSFMNMDAENIRFHTMPGNTVDYVGPESYVTIYVDEWLEMVNSILSPLYDDITDKGVSILTRGGDRRLYVTDGVWAGDSSWGVSSRGPDPNASAGNGSSGSPATSSPQPGASGDDGDDGEDGPPGEDGDPDDYDPSDGDPDGGRPPDDGDDNNYDDPDGYGDPGDPYDPTDPTDPAGTQPGDEPYPQQPSEPQYETPPENIDPLDYDPYEGLGSGG